MLGLQLGVPVSPAGALTTGPAVLGCGGLVDGMTTVHYWIIAVMMDGRNDPAGSCSIRPHFVFSIRPRANLQPRGQCISSAGVCFWSVPDVRTQLAPSGHVGTCKRTCRYLPWLKVFLSMLWNKVADRLRTQLSRSVPLYLSLFSKSWCSLLLLHRQRPGDLWITLSRI